MRALIIAIGLVLLASVSAAQNPPSIAWDFYPNASATDMVTLYRYRVTMNGTPLPLLMPTCVTECVAPLGTLLSVGTSYTLVFEVACAGTPTAFGAATTTTFVYQAAGTVTFPNNIAPGPNPCAPGGSANPSPPMMLGPCDYQAPASAAQPFPPMEQRTIGQMIQGFNPIGPSGIVGNQGERISQLKRWGWRVELFQFVEGNLRPDRIDRLFLIVECKGKAAPVPAPAGQV